VTQVRNMMIRKVMHRRRWFQFSLATLLVLIAGFSVLLAWIGRQVRNSEKELAERRQTVQELAKISGRATGWSDETGASRIVFEGTHFDAPALEQLKQTLARNPNINGVSLFDTVGTNGALAALAKSDRLEELQMQRADVTDDGLTPIAEMPNVRRLYAKDKWIKLEGRPPVQASSTAKR
jgi:hypothetical protein